MYAESFPNSIDLIVLLCSARMFRLECCLDYRFVTVRTRTAITEASSYPSLSQNEFTRDTEYQLRRSRSLSRRLSRSCVGDVSEVVSELSRSRSKVIEGH